MTYRHMKKMLNIIRPSEKCKSKKHNEIPSISTEMVINNEVLVRMWRN